MKTRKQDFAQEIFGEKIEDPYRWLEDSESEEVRAWTRAQNERTRAAFERCPERESLRARMRELLRTGYVMAPFPRKRANGWRYFWMERRGDAVQPTLYFRDGDAPKRALVDVAALSEDGTDALDWWYPSPDGSRLAWGRSRSGSEKSELYIREVDSGRDLDDSIPDTRHASVAWIDHDRFLYTRYPEGQDYGARVYEHVIGRSWREDPCVFGDGRAREDIPQVMITPDARYAIVRVHQGWDRSEVHAWDREKNVWTEIAKGALFEPIPTNECLWIMTNENAPRWELRRYEWMGGSTTIIPQGDDVLAFALPQTNRIVTARLRDAATIVQIHDKHGKKTRALDLGIVSAEISGDDESDEAFVMTTSFVSPTRVLRLREDTELFESAGEDAKDVIVERIDARSKDGTRVFMFVVRKKDQELPAPVLINGYGGFNVNQTPAYSVRALAAVERGLVFVSTVIRGGGELGEAWHEGGMLDRKQNVFDDFIACAEELVQRGIAAPGKIAAIGGSNGGLLVAAVCVQRPDLYRVGISLVPLADMLRYHLFRIGRLWIPEYGDPDKEEHFRFLHAYSPYHHVRADVRYPSMLFATAEADSRVDPMHARKMAARMQEASDRPVLLRVEEKAGHGQGKPASKVGEEVADELAFVLEELR